MYSFDYITRRDKISLPRVSKMAKNHDFALKMIFPPKTTPCTKNEQNLFFFGLIVDTLSLRVETSRFIPNLGGKPLLHSPFWVLQCKMVQFSVNKSAPHLISIWMYVTFYVWTVNFCSKARQMTYMSTRK